MSRQITLYGSVDKRVLAYTDHRKGTCTVMVKRLRFTFTLPSARDWIKGLRRFSPFPQYFWYSSTDCDLMHVEHPVRYRTGWHAYHAIQDEYDHAEGPTSFTPITRKEYLDLKREGQFVRDDIAARMEGY